MCVRVLCMCLFDEFRVGSCDDDSIDYYSLHELSVSVAFNRVANCSVYGG